MSIQKNAYLFLLFVPLAISPLKAMLREDNYNTQEITQLALDQQITLAKSMLHEAPTMSTAPFHTIINDAIYLINPLNHLPKDPKKRASFIGAAGLLYMGLQNKNVYNNIRSTANTLCQDQTVQANAVKLVASIGTAYYATQAIEDFVYSEGKKHSSPDYFQAYRKLRTDMPAIRYFTQIAGTVVGSALLYNYLFPLGSKLVFPIVKTGGKVIFAMFPLKK